MRFILYLIITFFIVSYNAIAQTESIRVFSKKGNIYYTQGYKITTQLTVKGLDHFPVLSPNHDLIAFVRIGDKKLPPTLGSYDWYWLFSPTGKEIRSLSNEQRNHALK